MKKTLIWNRLESTFITYKELWSKEEREESPTVTDRLLRYLISYYESPSVARKAIRRFYSIDGYDFCDLNETRVSYIRHISESLKEAGAKGNVEQLAFTIKDFLQNAWETLHTVDLTLEYKDNPEGAVKYLNQLSGDKDAWAKGESSPFRPRYTFFKRRNLITDSEPILPDCAIEYLKILWGIKSSLPYEFYTDRILSRLGIVNKKDTKQKKIKELANFISGSPVSRHRILIMMGKTICTQNPRCRKCPISSFCCEFQSSRVSSKHE